MLSGAQNVYEGPGPVLAKLFIDVLYWGEPVLAKLYIDTMYIVEMTAAMAPG